MYLHINLLFFSIFTSSFFAPFPLLQHPHLQQLPWKEISTVKIPSYSLFPYKLSPVRLAASTGIVAAVAALLNLHVVSVDSSFFCRFHDIRLSWLPSYITGYFSMSSAISFYLPNFIILNCLQTQGLDLFFIHLTTWWPHQRHSFK